MAAATAPTQTPTRAAPDEPGPSWMFFVAAVIGVAVVKEAFHGLGQNRVAVRARGTTRADRMFALGVAARLLERLGARILGLPFAQ